MVDLTERAGFPLALDEASGALSWDGPSPASVSHRFRADLAPVLLDPGAPGPDPAYTMYRDVGTDAERREAAARGLRYDVTVLAPGRLGREFVKTFGHDHPEKPGTGVAYPELYQVVHGHVLYLLQRRADGGRRGFADVALVSARAGDAVLIAPGYGHVTVNVGPDWLVMANWVARGFSSDYERVREDGGAAVFVVGGEGGAAEGWCWLPNRRALGGAHSTGDAKGADGLAPRTLAARAADPIFPLLSSAPGALECLVSPEAHAAAFDTSTFRWEMSG